MSGDTSKTGPASKVPGVQSDHMQFGEIGAEDSADRVTGAWACCRDPSEDNVSKLRQSEGEVSGDGKAG